MWNIWQIDSIESYLSLHSGKPAPWASGLSTDDLEVRLNRQLSDPASSIERHTPLRHFMRTRLGIDRAIAFTVLGRGWASLAGILTVALIARFLSPAEQGYYYTFASLIALQVIFELGFSFVVLQMASHERAHLTISADGTISGDSVAHDRLASVLQKTVRWYSSAAILLATFLVIAGSHFFSSHAEAALVSWRIPWYAAALAATLTFELDPMLSFLEGCGFVSNVARVRLGQAIAGSLLAWVALATHHGLFAPAMVIAGNAAVTIIWLFRKRSLLLPLLRRHPGANRIHWIDEVWDFQWRIAVSWLCGYFVFQLYNPVLFAYHGPIVAGQMGMSLSISSALVAISVSWVNTKAAPFGSMIARKDYKQLDRIFFQAVGQSLGVCIMCALTVWLGFLYLNHAGFRLAYRVLPPFTLALLFLNVPINVITLAQATYLRAHKQEKFLFNSILGAILVGSSTYFLGKSYGALGVVTGSVLAGLFVGLPLNTYTFFRYRKIWHAG